MARRGRSGGGHRGGGGDNYLIGFIVTLILIFVGLQLVATFGPQIGNITYSGEGWDATIFDVAKWLIPGIAVVALIVMGIRKLIGRG